MAQGRAHHLFDGPLAELGPSDVAPTDTHAKAFLSEAEMGMGWLLPQASNYTFLVELCQDNTHGYGVYKPEAGEAPLWDFPLGLYRRECATYVLSRLLGWPMVPPTVRREGELGVGSLQLYVPPVEESNYYVLLQERSADLFRMAVFDIVANNADRKAGHCFEAKSGGVWGIDHGLTFHVEHKLRTVIWEFGGQQIPKTLLDNLRGLAEQLQTAGSNAVAELEEWITHREMQALSRRVDLLLQDFIMPQPQRRRDFPWPRF